MTRTAILLAALTLPALALASSGGQDAHGKESPADVILHHVSDTEEWEFEIPFPGVEHNPILFRSEWFEFMRVERTPGACTAEVPKAFGAAPSLGRWLNGCWDLRPTKALLMMWISFGILLLVLLVFSHRDRTKLVPRGPLTNLIEAVVVYIRDEIARPHLGHQLTDRYLPFLCTMFFLILTMNWVGLVPNFAAATGAVGVTAGLAISSFLLIQVSALRAQGLRGYFLHLTAEQPWYIWPLIVPIELVSQFTKPLALTIRLFANMLAGHIVLYFLIGMGFLLHYAATPVAVPLGVAIYLLEFFVGLVQAYVFTILTAVFLSEWVVHHHEDEHGEAHGHAQAAHH